MSLSADFIWRATDIEILPRAAGGKGSGNFDHAGRPGEVGGSAESVAKEAMRAIMEEHDDRIKNPRLSRPVILMGDLPVREREYSEYLEKNGQEWKPAPHPEGIREGKLNLCFTNASNLLIEKDLAYVEGVAYRKSLPSQMGFLHAWNVDGDGNVIDNTWGYDPDNKYFGVRYDKAQYLAHMVRTKTYGVFGGDARAAQKVLKKGGL